MATDKSIFGFFTTILVVLCLFLSLVHALPTSSRRVGMFGNVARRSVTIDLERNPTYRINGPAAYAHALKRWGAEVPSQLVKSLAAMRGHAGEVDATSISNDREYLSKVGFGTPRQWLNVDLDTGSADVWVYSSETRAAVAGDRAVWNIDKSATARKVENATWMISYGDGSSAWGTVYTDVVTLGGITVPNATVESAVSASTSLTSDADIDGVFGLAYGLPSQTSPQQPSVMAALLPYLAEPLFTADLRYHSARGAYTFGRIDRARYANSKEADDAASEDGIFYTPLSPGARFWQFPYTGVHVGGQNVWYLYDFSAIADTGTSLLLLGREIVELYYAAVPGASRNWTVGGLWTYPCDLAGGNNNGQGQGQGQVQAGDASAAAAGEQEYDGDDGGGDGGQGGDGGEGDAAEATMAELPDFEIGFANGFVATVPGRYLNYTAMPDDASMCMGGLQEFAGADFGILGDVFLKAVYAVFDVGGARIGFAQKDLEA